MFRRQTIRLGDPFLIVATQVSFGTAGTYPLSEVQSDRFAFSAFMSSPSLQEKLAIISRINEFEPIPASKLFRSTNWYQALKLS